MLARRAIDVQRAHSSREIVSLPSALEIIQDAAHRRTHRYRCCIDDLIIRLHAYGENQ
jgi:hypothetical protein